MKVAIIEDEHLASDRLAYLLRQYDPAMEVVASLESIEETVRYLTDNVRPDLLLMDIQLSDGISFDIFKQVRYEGPIIFTTAFDKFAIETFQYFSIDYILKPVTLESLSKALNKLRTITKTYSDYNILNTSLQKMFDQYKARFLGKVGQRLFLVDCANISYFQAEDKLVYLVDDKGNRYLVDYTLEKLETVLDPKEFFRLNRRYIVRIGCIECIKSYPNNRLKLVMKSAPKTEDFIVSRERVAQLRSLVE
jgi:two-component system, LytTR family, response regulator LytT